MSITNGFPSGSGGSGGNLVKDIVFQEKSTEHKTVNGVQILNLQFTSTYTNSKYTGTCIKDKGVVDIACYLETPLSIQFGGSTWDAGYLGILSGYSYSYENWTTLNRALAQADSEDNTGVYFQPYGGQDSSSGNYNTKNSWMGLTWDLGVARTATLKLRANWKSQEDSSYYIAQLYFQGSNDGTSWTQITKFGDLDSSSLKTVSSTTAYRYYRIYETIPKSINIYNSSQLTIYHVSLHVNSYEEDFFYNLFTCDNDFTKNNIIMGKTPSNFDNTGVAATRINGIPTDTLLPINSLENLVYTPTIIHRNTYKTL